MFALPTRLQAASLSLATVAGAGLMGLTSYIESQCQGAMHLYQAAPRGK